MIGEDVLQQFHFDTNDKNCCYSHNNNINN